MTSAGRIQDRNVEGILQHMRDYMSARAQQASRINPRIAGIIDDLLWTQLENLRLLLEKQKMFGPERIRVGDILASDDDLKRKNLFSHSDQNSIIYEIVDKVEEGKKAMAEMAIHDARSYFRALEPSLENMIQLIQHWILWDLPDASDLFHFDEQMRRLFALHSATITDELRARYRAVLRKRAEEALTDADILRFELRRLEVTMTRFSSRRAEEDAYVIIVKREEQHYSASNQEILKISLHVKNLDVAEKLGASVDRSVAETYAPVLHLPIEEISAAMIVDYEKKMIAESKRRLESYLHDDRSLGDPFDYKKAQARQLHERYAAEAERCEEIIKLHEEAVQAQHAPSEAQEPPASE